MLQDKKNIRQRQKTFHRREGPRIHTRKTASIDRSMDNSRKLPHDTVSPDHHTMDSFEAQRRIELDTCHDKDKDYWQAFQKVIQSSQEANKKLQLFFQSKIQAEENYCAALAALGATLVPPENDLESLNNAQYLLLNPSIKMNTQIGHLPEKIVQKFQAFHTHQRRYVLSYCTVANISIFLLILLLQ